MSSENINQRIEAFEGKIKAVKDASGNLQNYISDIKTSFLIKKEELKARIKDAEDKLNQSLAPKVEVSVEKPSESGSTVSSETVNVGVTAPTPGAVVADVVEEKKVVGVTYSVEDFTSKKEKTVSEEKDYGKKPFKTGYDKKKGGTEDKDDKYGKLNKKAKIQKGYESNNVLVEYDDESGEIMKVRSRRSSGDKKKTFTPTAVKIDHAVMTSETITVKQLSEKIGKTGVEIIKKLFELNIVKTINDMIDFETAELVSDVLGVKLELQLTQTSEDILTAMHDENAEENAADLKERPPVVTIMGHVDHGKTSILDYIRKSNVASGEAGGITQHIGAYTINIGGKPISFLDTPGHEAFTAMRARGANVTDIVVIVVAADDGIMPQTIEAINHAKAAKNVSIIVAVNKMDKVGANPARVVEQLSQYGILAEEWGGTVPVVKVSAKTGMGMNDLLETIVLTAEVMELKANPDRDAKGAIIEAKLDKGKGPIATVLVQNGTLHVGDFIIAGTVIGRVRAMFDDKGRQINKAGPSTPVSVLGLQDVPNAGDELAVCDEKLSKQVVEDRKLKTVTTDAKRPTKLEDMFKDGDEKNLNLVIKADVQGSAEAVKQSLEKLSNDEVTVKTIHNGVGAISESDVNLAYNTHSIIIGFNVRPDTKAKQLSDQLGVDIKTYRIIYDAINDVTLAIKGLLAPTYKETYLGRAEVRQLFKISNVGTIAGCMVKDGKITRNAKIRLLRDNVVITEATVASLRRMKDDVKEVASGYDCGMSLEGYNDIREGDVFEAYIMEENV